jgi:hypothetical protein
MGCPFRGGGQKLRRRADPLQIRCGPPADPLRSAAETVIRTNSDHKCRSRIEELEALYAHAQAQAQAQANSASRRLDTSRLENAFLYYFPENTKLSIL